MSTTAGTIRDDIQRRLRSADALLCSNLTPPTTADGQAFIFAIMTYGQLYVNAAERLQLNAATITWPAAAIALQIIGQVDPLIGSGGAGNGTNILTILDVRIHGGNELQYTNWRNLGRHDVHWLSNNSNPAAPNTWSVIGKDVFVLSPGITGTMIDITYVPTMDNEILTNDAQTFIIPDDSTPDVAAFSELVLRIKTRQLDGFKARFDRLVEAMGIQYDTRKSTRDDGSAL